MEIAKPASSLEQKLQLLKALRSGRLQQSEKMLANLTATSRTNPALYSKFHSFLAEHRRDIEDIENQEKEEEVKVVLVEGSDDSWATDDSVDLSIEEEEAEQPVQHEETQVPKHDEKNERRLMRNVSNTKSTALLHHSKQKHPFLVQTKMKEGKSHASTLLKRGSSVTKLDLENKSLLTTLSKSNLLTKNLPKQASKPYFPPINAAKFTLKLK